MGLTPTFGVMMPMAASGSMANAFTLMWAQLKTFPFLVNFLMIIGTCLILFALIKMVMAKMRNRPMDTKELVWALVIGTFLVFPYEIINLLLGIADGFIAMFKKLLLQIPNIK